MTVTVFGRKLPATATYAGALATALMVLLITVIAVFWAADQLRLHNDAVRQSFETRAALRTMLITLQDAETGQRGYLLTGEESYLEPYEQALTRGRAVLASLDGIAAVEPRLAADVARLHELADLKIEELARTIALARTGRRLQAMALVESDRGKQIMDDARALIESVLDDEGLRLNHHLSDAERGADALSLIVVWAAVLLLGIGVLLAIAVRRGMAELRASRDQVQATNSELVAEMANRQRAENKMVHMQKMEAIGQLTGGVAHDFNNMLAVIISALQLMQRRLERGDTDVQRFLDAAQDGARRAATLTSRLLAFARRQPLNPAVTDVNRLVEGMSELLRRTLGETIELETVSAGGLWRTLVDVSQLENALVNICVNARDAMANGGKLTIETANAFLDDAYAANNPEVIAGQYVMIAVTDTGEGMSADVVARAFEPFFTTKEVGKGTGLGLSHVHGFLKQSGGHAAIYSELGHGTTVKLYLPRTQRAEETAEAAAPLTAAPAGDAGTIVLVVEDEERVRLLSVATLRELGYTVLHASGGAEALALLVKNPGVHLLFTDIVMPDMGGWALADQARRRNPALKVLYTTGYTQNAIVHNGVVDADARLILKPYGLDDLARKVRAVLDES